MGWPYSLEAKKKFEQLFGAIWWMDHAVDEACSQKRLRPPTSGISIWTRFTKMKISRPKMSGIVHSWRIVGYHGTKCIYMHSSILYALFWLLISIMIMSQITSKSALQVLCSKGVALTTETSCSNSRQVHTPLLIELFYLFIFPPAYVTDPCTQTF